MQHEISRTWPEAFVPPRSNIRGLRVQLEIPPFQPLHSCSIVQLLRQRQTFLSAPSPSKWAMESLRSPLEKASIINCIQIYDRNRWCGSCSQQPKFKVVQLRSWHTFWNLLCTEQSRSPRQIKLPSQERSKLRWCCFPTLSVSLTLPKL